MCQTCHQSPFGVAERPVPDPGAPVDSTNDKRPKKPRRKVFAFYFPPEELLKRGEALNGVIPPDDDGTLQLMRLTQGRYHLIKTFQRHWKRTQSVRVRASKENPHVWGLALADNLSSDTINPPPQEIIDVLKKALVTTQEPAWYPYNLD